MVSALNAHQIVSIAIFLHVFNASLGLLFIMVDVYSVHLNAATVSLIPMINAIVDHTTMPAMMSA